MGEVVSENQAPTPPAAAAMTVEVGRFTLVVDEAAPDRSLQKLRGVGPRIAARLVERGFRDQADLLLAFPRTYRRTHRFPCGDELESTRPEYVRAFATVVSVNGPSKWNRRPVEVVIACDDCRIVCVWFNMRSGQFSRQFQVGRTLVVEGAIDWARGLPRMTHPTIQWTTAEPTEPSVVCFEPVYPGIEGVSPKLFDSAVRESLERLEGHLVEVVPSDLRKRFDVPRVADALRIVHASDGPDDEAVFQARLDAARERMVYEEFFTLQAHLAQVVRAERARRASPVMKERGLGRDLVRSLPFKLTADQREASRLIAEDLARPHPMRRLLQGDVGSGKTVVALSAAAIAAGSGYQVALMAPTEVLAMQHLARTRQFLGEVDIDVAFLSGSTSPAERRDVLARLAAGEIDILIGTHALFSDDVVYRALGLVIVDEQHKFGVEQRDALLTKGRDPHLLAMTATPIPRSLAHTLFGDLELTLIREKPAGREPVRTHLRDRSARDNVYAWVADQVGLGHRAYVVYPAIDESTVRDVAHLLGGAEQLANGPFRGRRVGVLHGRMPPADKLEILRRFESGAIDVLCATTVVEVGIDVAEATIMVIESPEAFGLSQLHQLRGRVGRGHETSRCILLAGAGLPPDTAQRLEVFARTTDGFELAEMDLLLRGPGEFTGARQSGAAEFRFGDLVRDAELLAQARRDARTLLFGDVAAP